MPTNILMPALSPTMKQGNIVKWLKKKGDIVKSGDVISEIETDKATMEIEAPEDGKILEIKFPEGEKNVKVNEIIALLLEEDEDEEDITKTQDTKESTNNEAKIKDEETPIKQDTELVEKDMDVTTTNTQKETKIEHQEKVTRISPLAKKLSEDNNINTQRIKGSGPYGRIIKRDIIRLLDNIAPTKSINRILEEYKILPISNMRKVIAERLSYSKQSIPHFYLNLDCNLDKLLSLRNDINNLAQEKKDYKISVNDFIIKACAQAISEIPEANRSWSEKGILAYNNIDICVAVSIEEGLITPMIKNADTKDLISISNESKSLINKARTNSLKPEEFQGGSFTISNLGMFNIENFNAIINPPQSSILSVGKAQPKAIIIDNVIKIANIMNLSLSCDHRIIDGIVGAKLLNKIKEYLENPISLINIR